MAIKVSGTTVIDDSRNLQNSVNLNVTGNVYANTFIGDGSQLTNLPPSGGTVTATASGTLSDGSTVVVNADGTVSVVGLVPASETLGSGTTFEDSGTGYYAATFDSTNNKVVLIYQDWEDSSYGKAIIGTVSDNSISFGTPVVFASYESNSFGVTYDSSNDRIVIGYSDRSSTPRGRAIVGTVSGTSISFGSSVDLGINYLDHFSLTFDSTSNKVIIVFRDGQNADAGKSFVGTVSGTSISFGSVAQFTSQTNSLSVVYDSNADKVLVAYRDTPNSAYGRAEIGTVSGTGISWGSEYTFNSGTTTDIAAVFDSNSNKVVILYNDESNSGYGTAIVATISGSSISYGSEVVFNAGNTADISATFDSTTNKVVIAYRDEGDSGKGKIIAGTVSGTSISFGSEVLLDNAGRSHETLLAYDSDSKRVVVGYAPEPNQYGVAKVFQNAGNYPNLTSSNYLGISDGVYANNVAATIQVAGAVDDAQSSLTPGQQYFVQTNGSIGTTAGSPSVFAGTAVAATKLLVKG